MSDSIRQSNTGKAKPTKEKAPVNKKGLTQLEINIVEARLTLNGGTLPQEIGGTLANKFGEALKQTNIATTALSYLDKIRDVDKRKKATLEARQNLEAAKLARKEEVGAYTSLAMEYISKTYGAEVRNESNRLMGYGDKIEVLKNRHLRKVW